DAMIISADLGVVKIEQVSVEVNFRFSGSHRQTGDVDASAGQNQRSVCPPHERRRVRKARSDAPHNNMRVILPPQQRILQLQRQVARGEFEGYFFVFPQKLAALRFNLRNGERDELLNRPLVSGQVGLGHGSVSGAVGIINEVDYGMLQHKRVQSDGGAEEGDDFQFRLEAVDVKKRRLIRCFMPMNSQVASIYAQTEWNGVQFSQFHAAAGEFLRRSNHFAADPLLKGIGGDVPGEQCECDQTENGKQQKKFPQDAPPHRRNGLDRLLGHSWFNGSVLQRRLRET